MIVNGVRLGAEDVVRLRNSATVAQRLEDEYLNKVRREMRRAARADAERVTAGSEPVGPDLETLFVEHYFDVTIQALRLAQQERELDQIAKKRLARPRSLADIMRLYDAWKRGLYTPKKTVKRAIDLKKKYLDAVHKAWRIHSEAFRQGDTFTQESIVAEIQAQAETTTARAETIVRTETTKHYNQARRDYYDQGDEVTHYLFLAVRDKATTPWCTTKTTDGKRGRSGLVYAKADPLLESETPPCHWNCRSEIVPLNRFNPAHRKLIADRSIARRNHQCTPLPPGWNK